MDLALTQHERLISPEVRPLHDHLVTRFKAMRESMAGSAVKSPVPLARRASATRKGPLPPVPASSTSGSLAEQQQISKEPVYSLLAGTAQLSSAQLMTVSLNVLPTVASPQRMR